MDQSITPQAVIISNELTESLKSGLAASSTRNAGSTFPKEPANLSPNARCVAFMEGGQAVTIWSNHVFL